MYIDYIITCVFSLVRYYVKDNSTWCRKEKEKEKNI